MRHGDRPSHQLCFLERHPKNRDPGSRQQCSTNHRAELGDPVAGQGRRCDRTERSATGTVCCGAEKVDLVPNNQDAIAIHLETVENLSLEGLSVSPVSGRVVAAVENALVQDGPRFLRFQQPVEVVEARTAEAVLESRMWPRNAPPRPLYIESELFDRSGGDYHPIARAGIERLLLS